MSYGEFADGIWRYFPIYFFLNALVVYPLSYLKNLRRGGPKDHGRVVFLGLTTGELVSDIYAIASIPIALEIMDFLDIMGMANGKVFAFLMLGSIVLGWVVEYLLDRMYP